MTSTQSATNFGIDSFSFHRYFGETSRWELPSDISWRTEDFFDFVRAHKLNLITLQTAYLDYDDPATQSEIKNWIQDNYLAFTWGHPNGFDGGRNQQALANATLWLERSSELGLDQMRIVLGNHLNYSQPATERFELLREPLTKLVNRAQELGVRLSIENHADFNVPTLLEFIREINSPYLGLCFDLGNSFRVGDNLRELIEQIDTASIFMIQAKEIDQALDNTPGEPIGWWPTVPFGTGKIDIGYQLNRLIERGFSGPIAIELSNLNSGLDEIEVAKAAITYLRKNLR
jgi:sugar phosphate isomerase/epimerase